MRDLVFKNLTSQDKSRKVLLAKEIINEDGIVTRIQKHLVYVVHQVPETEPKDEGKKIKNELFIIKERNTKVKSETFFIKMKSGMYANCNNKLYLINFLHSLKIDLTPAIQVNK